MNDQVQSRFVYVTYIHTTPEKLWRALTDPEFIRQYWFGMTLESAWEKGAPWKMVNDAGLVTDDGEVLEADPPNRLVLRWRHQWRPELKAEGDAICTYALEVFGETVKLTITHESGVAHAKLIEAVSGGWPRILSNLKSFLETGSVWVPYIQSKPQPEAQA